MAHEPRSIAVVGGGITGLAAAHRLVEIDPSLRVRLIEAAGQLGGVIETVEAAGVLNEHSADSFITNVPWALELCRRVGLADELLETNAPNRHAFVVRGGRLYKVPQGFLLMAPSQMWPILTTPLLSLRGKLRLLAEYFVPAKRDAADESLGTFVRRRLGPEAFDRLVQPLVGGIYTADPEKLSVRATMPRFLDMERDAGSLIRGTIRDAAARRQAGDSSGARYSLFMTPRHGLASLVEAIAQRLPEGTVELATRVAEVALSETRWRLTLQDSCGQSRSETFDGLILATQAYRAAPLLEPIDAGLAADLASIEYASSAVVSLVYRRSDVDHPLDGFGFVVPAAERRRILSASFSSVKFAGRAPQEQVLIRVFIGGACQAQLLDLDDAALRQIATEELSQLVGAHGQTLSCEIRRWPRSMPQYHLGHCELVERIEQRTSALPRLALAGNAYHGVGIPHCIHSGEQAAQRVAQAAGAI